MSDQFRRETGNLKKLSASRRGLIKDGIIKEVDRSAVYRAGSPYTYDDVPKDAGPPYRPLKERSTRSVAKPSKG